MVHLIFRYMSSLCRFFAFRTHKKDHQNRKCMTQNRFTRYASATSIMPNSPDSRYNQELAHVSYKLLSTRVMAKQSSAPLLTVQNHLWCKKFVSRVARVRANKQIHMQNLMSMLVLSISKMIVERRCIIYYKEAIRRNKMSKLN